MGKKVKLEPKDFDAKDFLSMFTEQVAAAMKKGVGKGLAGGGDLLSEMKKSLEEISKNEKDSAKTAAIRQMALDRQISAERAALVIAVQQRKEELNTLMLQKQSNIAVAEQLMLNAELMGNMKAFYGYQERLTKLQEDLSGLQNEKKELKVTSGLLYDKLEAQEKLTEEQEKQDAVAEKMHEVSSALKTQIGLTEELRAQLSTPELAKAVFAEQMLEKINQAGEAFDHFKEQGLSAGQAVQAQMKTLSLSSLMGLSDAKGAADGFIQAYGSIGGVSKELINDVGHLAHEFGITGQEAAALNASLSQMPGQTSETAKDAMEMTGHLAEMQGIAPGAIMKDMAENTAEMARAGAKGAEGFGKSVIALHKMGVEMSTASKVADGLLDFESSINAQMEASALLGKNINLDKARELALNNDLEGMTAEIAANIGGSAEFSKMNRLQQDALAKSVGMSLEELTKMMDAQEESNKYFGEAAGPLDNLMGGIVTVGGGIKKLVQEQGMMILSLAQTGMQYATMNALKAQNVALTGRESGATIFGTIATKASALANKAWNMIKGLGTTITNTSIGTNIKDRIVTIAGTISTGASTLAQKAWNFMKTTGTSITNSSILANIRDRIVTVAGYIATGVASTAQGAYNMIKGAGNAIMSMGIIGKVRDTAVTVAGYIATGVAAAAQGAWNIAKGVGNFLMSTSIGMWIAEKVQIVASTVAKWLNVGANTAIAASAGTAATATAASGTAAAGASGGFLAFGTALGAFGAAAAPAIPVILAIGAALLMASPAIYVLGEVIKTIAQVIGNVLMKALEMIPPTITAIADGFVTIFTSVANNIGAMLALGPALLMVGAGLGLVGTFGLTAMPVIGALIALAVVAPALVALGSALGSIFGGEGGEGDKEDKMQILIDEIRGLRSEMSKGGVVNMDGKKVGETLRLAMNTSGIR